MRSHYVIFLSFMTVAISGCSALKNESKIDIDTFSAKEIYDLADDRLAKNRPQDAAKYFSEIERLYPYSEWAKRGLIMQAYSFHKDEDYENQPQRGATLHRLLPCCRGRCLCAVYSGFELL